MKTLGKHLIIELFGVDQNLLNNSDKIEAALTVAAEKSGATVVAKKFTKFNPHGITGVVIIAESHISIHTWPELRYAAVDIFTCGDKVNPWNAYDVIVDELKPKNINVTEISRGVFSLRGEVT
ncbi:MAG: adenosylmethionine decarboxylase [Candidatus Hydrothermarchaeota archaeon]